MVKIATLNAIFHFDHSAVSFYGYVCPWNIEPYMEKMLKVKAKATGILSC